MEHSGKQVTVTGATGFIALHCIQQLLEAGYRVRGTVRSLERESKVRAALSLDDEQQARLSFVEVNLTEDGGWAEAFSGSTFGLHVASPLPKAPPKDEDELIRPAWEGTLGVLRAAADAGVQRVVVTSSVAAIYWGQDPARHTFTEEDWSDPAIAPPYDKSKTLAERAAWEFSESPEARGMELAVINPTYVIGPSLSGEANTSNELVNKLLRREVPGLPRIRLIRSDRRREVAPSPTANTSRTSASDATRQTSPGAQCLGHPRVGPPLPTSPRTRKASPGGATSSPWSRFGRGGALMAPSCSRR